MVLISEIQDSLKSEKVREREKGRKECNELLQQDSSNEQFVKNDTWKDLFTDLLTCLRKENDACVKKKKSCGIETVQLWKKVIRHVVHHVVEIREKWGKSLQTAVIYVLKILKPSDDSQYYSNDFKEEHRYILCDLLEPKMVHFLSWKTLLRVLEMLKQEMINVKSATNKMNLRILKQLCQAMFVDSTWMNPEMELHHEGGIDGPGPEHWDSLLLALLTWFSDTLIPLAQDDASAAQTTVTATVAECCTSILTYSGINQLFSLIFPHIRTIMRAVVRQLAVCLRDTYRTPCLKFVAAYVETITSCGLSSCAATRLLSQPSSSSRCLSLQLHVLLTLGFDAT